MESLVFSKCLLFMIVSVCLNGFFCLGSSEDANYLIGVGSYDITGPAADVVMMGYGNIFEQRAAGIHFRLRARAFIVAEQETDKSDGGNRVVFVNLDACMASQLVTLQVLQRLKHRYGDLYNEKNVAISGIHTHSGPGGYFQYWFYSLATLGFLNQSLNAIVDGVEQSIVKAHENLRPGSIFVNKGELLNAGISRSPSAYLRNPAEEREKYKHNVDTDMTLLKFVDSHSVPVGSFNWFPTHGTSMSRHNRLISGDNKGAAARFMEDWYMQQAHTYSSSAQNSTTESNPSSSIHSQKTKSSIKSIAARITKTGGKPCSKSSSTKYRVRNSKMTTFVAAFCQSNVGDVSPNVKGAFCADTGLPCDFNTSTCNGDNQLCIGQGPGYPNDFESTRIIADRQFKQAIDLFTSAKEKLSGRIDYRHVYLNFTNIPVKLTDNQEKMVTTCPAALGPGFAAGTTDGPGDSDFKQGDTKISEKWRIIRDGLKKPTKEQINCQKPKSVLLDTGEMFDTIPWAPAILPIQILRIGQFIILSVPGEFTTMAGRRLRAAVKETLIANGNGEYNDDTYIVIAGLTNTYSQYITTYEEYQAQRYEGASTLYGPHTLSAYIQEFRKLAKAMAQGNSIPDNGQSPPDLLADQHDSLGPVSPDKIPSSTNFGDVKEDVSETSYKIGDTVSATFWSGNPRNDLLTEGTFSVVEFYDGSRKWIPAYDDDDFSVFFKWAQKNDTFYGVATIQWSVPVSAVIGTYRIRHFGAASIQGQHPVIQYFTGTSSTFSISK